MYFGLVRNNTTTNGVKLILTTTYYNSINKTNSVTNTVVSYYHRVNSSGLSYKYENTFYFN